MRHTVEELLAIARLYWRSDMAFDSHPTDSPEAQRFFALWAQRRQDMAPWHALLDEFRGDLPGFSIRDITSPSEACLRCAAHPSSGPPPSPPEWVVVGCASLLAPVYAVYGVRFEYRGEELLRYQLFLEQLPPEMGAPAAALARRLETSWGLSALPPEVALAPVPLFVQAKAPPRTTLFHALFTSTPASVP